MSKPANKTVIGVFVVIAVVLAVTAVILFGSGKFFRETEPWIVFFDGSVKGLNVGSPVVFRGVQIGQVTDIIVGFDPAALEVIIPVIFEIDPERFMDIGERVERADEEMVQALIERGFRAQLQTQSLVTGQLVINLDFLPDTEARLVGLDRFADKINTKDLAEVPSIQTTMQRLERTIENIDFQAIVDDIRRAMDGIAKLATSPDLHASIGELKETLVAIKELTREVQSKVEPLATSIDQTLVDARGAIGDTRKLITNIDRQTGTVISKIGKAAESAKTALDHADSTLKSIENLADEGTQLRHEISSTLTEIEAASRSVRVLADFIEQNPDAILRGRVIQTGGN